eukprot:293533-Chlamydomonas_euryale.AAC.1
MQQWASFLWVLGGCRCADLLEAVALHSAAICSLWPRRQAAWLDEFPEVLPSAAEPFAYADRLTTLAYKDD